MYEEIAEATGIGHRALRQYKQVAEKVKSGTRVPDLEWSHHREVASLPPEKQEGSVQFWIGDCLAYHEQKWGMYEEIAEATGIKRDQLRSYKYVSENVESALRNSHLEWSHHKEVAKLPPEKQEEFLQLAADNDFTVRDLRETIRRDNVEFSTAKYLTSNNETLKYQVIYADPPWSYGNSMPSGISTTVTYSISG